MLSHVRTRGAQQKHYGRHAFIEEKRQAVAVLEGHLFKMVHNNQSR